MKNLKNIYKVLFLLLVVISVSCSRSNDGDDDAVINSGGQYYVKATGSKGVVVNIVVIVVDGATHTLTLQSKSNTYTSEKYNVNTSFAASISAEGVDDNSTFKLELFKDGKVVKTSTSKGRYLNATVSH